MVFLRNIRARFLRIVFSDLNPIILDFGHHFSKERNFKQNGLSRNMFLMHFEYFVYLVFFVY